MQDSSVPAGAGSATPDEDSSLNDFGECTGCGKGERGGMRSELQQTHAGLRQVPISADGDGPLAQPASAIPTVASSPRLRPMRPMPVG